MDNKKNIIFIIIGVIIGTLVANMFSNENIIKQFSYTLVFTFLSILIFKGIFILFKKDRLNNKWRFLYKYTKNILVGYKRFSKRLQIESRL